MLINYNYVKEFIYNKGGVLLSSNYKNARTKLHIRCLKDNYEWNPTWDYLKQGTWCPKCAGKILPSIDEIRLITDSKNWLLLSTVCYSSQSKLHLICNLDGHEWHTNWNKIQQGTGCSKCSKHVAPTIDFIRSFIKNKDGILLSDIYTNSHSHLKVKCNKHNKIWLISWANLYSGKWCKECGFLNGAKKQNNSYILRHWKTNEELVCVGLYEKKVVEYLNGRKLNFRWQAKTFTLPNGKTYRPDLYLLSSKKWIEIKGYAREDFKEKWEWFSKTHTNSELWDKNKLKEMRIL